MKRLPELPAERALKVIAGRWKIVVLYHLFEAPKRLSEIKRLAPGASDKVLVQQLREMEEHGLISRKTFTRAAPRVEYTATDLGRSLAPIILSLCEWGRHHATELDEINRLAECRVGLPALRAAQVAGATTQASIGGDAPYIFKQTGSERKARSPTQPPR